MLHLRDKTPADASWVAEALSAEWGRPFVVSRGRGHQPVDLPGFVAERSGKSVGLLTYRVADAALEVVTLQAMERRSGVGSVLMRAARAHAQRQQCWRVWLVTTNDNTGAIAFYEAIGMRLAAIHRGALAEARKLKPDIPLVSAEGVPIDDELEFEFQLL